MRILRLLIAVVVTASVAQTAQAGLFGCLKPRGCGHTIAAGCCATPNPICTPKTKMEKVTKTCYKPKQEAVCIPPIKFPWMKCNEFGRPKIRCVNRFEKEEIDCGEKCVIVWKLDEEIAKNYCKCNSGGCFGGCKSCGGGCGVAGTCGPVGCTDGGCATEPHPVGVPSNYIVVP